MSLQSQQRLRVFDAYRGRGRRTNDLWLVYSIKTGRDWILSSNREFVHWVIFLETDPSVASFEFVADVEKTGHSAPVSVLLKNGSNERHVVTSRAVEDHQLADQLENDKPSDRIKFFTDVELGPKTGLAMRWLKAIAFAAVLRDKECAPVRTALVLALRTLGEGTIQKLIDELVGFEAALVYGMLIRLVIEGHVTIDLSNFGICSATPWRWCEQSDDMVA